MFASLLLSVALLFPTPQAESPIVARGAGFELNLTDLDHTLLSRRGMSEDGRHALDELLKASVMADIAQSSPIKVTDREVEEMFSYLDRETRRADPKNGLLDLLKKKNISVDKFTKLLRLQILQERLTRKALNIPDERRASSEEQELWLKQEMTQRGLERPAPPWKDGVVAICGTVRIGKQEFAEYLRASIPELDITQTAWHLLLLRAIERKMPDVSPGALEAAIDLELKRREAKHMAEYPQITYAQRLGAQGRNLESLRQGPSVRIAALVRLWVDRQLGADGLRQTYITEQQYFDGLYGRSVECYVIFLRAAKFVNTLNKRTFADAHRELSDLRSNISTLDDFKALSARYNEDIETRKRQGAWGFVASGTPHVPAELRQAIFQYVDQNHLTHGVMIPNVRINNGVTLLWLESVRPAPSWEAMGERVHNELRQRFVNETLPLTAVEMLLK